MVSTIRFVALFTAASTVLACEGECISGTTKEFLKMYSSPIHHVLQEMADKITNQCVAPDNRRQDPFSYINPVLNAYNGISFHSLEHAIFPSYFHGKCLYPNGTVPSGCPNPDCPVVCGTPGSMVHFYPILTRLVFDHISGQLANITSPGSKAFRQVNKMVLADAQKTRRSFSRLPRSAKLQARQTTGPEEKRLRAIMKEFPRLMLKACGGSNLTKCNWETRMKEFILQYP